MVVPSMASVAEGVLPQPPATKKLLPVLAVVVLPSAMVAALAPPRACAMEGALCWMMTMQVLKVAVLLAEPRQSQGLVRGVAPEEEEEAQCCASPCSHSLRSLTTNLALSPQDVLVVALALRLVLASGSRGRPRQRPRLARALMMKTVPDFQSTGVRTAGRASTHFL